MKQFSQLLVERIQAYFKEKYDLDVPDETAQEYLNSFASLYIVFAKVGQRGRANSGSALAEPNSTTLGGDTDKEE